MPGNSAPIIRNADAAAIAEAAAILRGGGLVAVPTETVYGLAARADSEEAVAAIYRAKGRPDFNPLIVHVTGVEQAEGLASFDDRARLLATKFWPGALTLVLPKRADAPLAAAVTAGLPTVALRCPAHPVMQALLADCGLPLAAPSANRSGAVSPTAAEHVVASFSPSPAGRGSGGGGARPKAARPSQAGEPPPQPLPAGEGLPEAGCPEQGLCLILEGGACAAGIESTIVALRETGWQVLRPGPVSEADLAAVLGEGALTVTEAKIEAPGQLASHYSPGKPLRLDAVEAREGEFHIGFGAVPGDWTLSPSGDLAEAAARLYAALHEAAASPRPRIAVAPIPSEGMGAAIGDRLRRAAA